MTNELSYESEALEAIHAKANTAKNECFFIGFIDGVLANGRVEETELEPLLAECGALCAQVGDEDAAEILSEAAAGHHDTLGELLDVLTQIAEIRSGKIDPACPRSAANRLLGFCAGINCDGIITTREAQVLHDRINAAHDLDTDPRIAALRHVVRDALCDGVIDPAEAAEISHLITSLVGDSYADTGIPSCEAIPVISDTDQLDAILFEGRHVVPTGGFDFGTRRQLTARLEELGATVQKTPTRETDFLIIGADGSPHYTHKSHGGKIGKALELRGDGHSPRIYLEAQLRAHLSP